MNLKNYSPVINLYNNSSKISLYLNTFDNSNMVFKHLQF